MQVNIHFLLVHIKIIQFIYFQTVNVKQDLKSLRLEFSNLPLLLQLENKTTEKCLNEKEIFFICEHLFCARR